MHMISYDIIWCILHGFAITRCLKKNDLANCSCQRCKTAQVWSRASPCPAPEKVWASRKVSVSQWQWTQWIVFECEKSGIPNLRYLHHISISISISQFHRDSHPACIATLHFPPPGSSVISASTRKRPFGWSLLSDTEKTVDLRSSLVVLLASALAHLCNKVHATWTAVTHQNFFFAKTKKLWTTQSSRTCKESHTLFLFESKLFFWRWFFLNSLGTIACLKPLEDLQAGASIWIHGWQKQPCNNKDDIRQLHDHAPKLQHVICQTLGLLAPDSWKALAWQIMPKSLWKKKQNKWHDLLAEKHLSRCQLACLSDLEGPGCETWATSIHVSEVEVALTLTCSFGHFLKAWAAFSAWGWRNRSQRWRSGDPASLYHLVGLSPKFVYSNAVTLVFMHQNIFRNPVSTV